MEVAAGHAFNLVLTREGRVFTWGRNEQGQVGTMGRRRAGKMQICGVFKDEVDKRRILMVESCT